MKEPVGFVKSYSRLIINPSEQPQYQGGNLIIEACGFWLIPEDEDESDDE